MKRIVFVIALMSAGPVFAIAPIGPPVSTLEKGQIAVGFGYGSGEADVVMNLLGLGLEVEAESEFDSYLGKIGFGITDGLEIFGRIGGAELEGPGGLAAGVGVKVTLVESANVDWGLAGQFTWAGFEDDGTWPELGARWHEESDLYAVQFAFGPVFKADPFRFYGGPLLVWVKGDGDLDVTGGPLPGSLPFDLEKELEVGGYVGLSLEIFDGSDEDGAASCDLNVEYQFGKDWSLFGLGLAFAF